MDFRVEISIFRGPLDLLLYLVRKHEVEIVDISVAVITNQYLEYLAVLEDLDVNLAADYLAMAATLVELKSQQVLPANNECPDEQADARNQLVRRLLEYKKYRDAASILEERGAAWQQHYPRLCRDLPQRERSLADEPIHEVEIWDLVSALARILRENEATQPASIVYDDTPIGAFMTRIHSQLLQRGQICFSALFEPGMHRSTIIGIFLAMLELVRHQRASIQQNDLFGEIWLLPGPKCNQPLDYADIDDYQHSRN